MLRSLPAVLPFGGARRYAVSPLAPGSQACLRDPPYSFHTRPATDFASLEYAAGEGSDEPRMLPRGVLKYFARRGYERPSPIQAQSLPISMAGRVANPAARGSTTGAGRPAP